MNILEDIEKQIEKAKLSTTAKNVGKIVEIGDGVVRAVGLSNVSASELIKFPFSKSRRGEAHDIYGLALNLEEDSVVIIVFSQWDRLKEGDTCETTGKIFEVPVG